MAEQKLNLLADFPAISTQEWKDKIIADLKGADFDKKLVWKTSEGFNVMPFYRQEDLENIPTKDVAPAQFPYVRSTKLDNEWLVRQDIDACCAKEANAKALDQTRSRHTQGVHRSRRQATTQQGATHSRRAPQRYYPRILQN